MHDKFAKELNEDRKKIIDRFVSNYVDNYGPLIDSPETNWILEAFEDNDKYMVTILKNGDYAIVRR